MKQLSRWLVPLCLMWLGVLAKFSTPACAQSTPTFLKYKVMGVVYAPPGSASNVTYGNSSLVGSTDTISSQYSTTASTSTSFGVKASLGLFDSASFDSTTSSGWTESSENINSLAIQTTQGNSISTMGPISSSLGVDHDNDVIYIWLNPVVTAYVSSGTLFWTGLSSNSCDGSPLTGAPTLYQDTLGCDSNQYPYPDIVGIPVWCLKNPYNPAQGCAQWIQYTSRYWDSSSWGTDPTTGLPLGPGLTMRDYADILQADPFVVMNGTAVNVCHPTYGPSLDPNEPEIYIAPPVSAPTATGSGGSCIIEPRLRLGVSAGALSGCTVLQAGAGCGTGSGVTFNIMGGGGIGTGGTVTPTWSSGALTGCTVSGGTGYKAPVSVASATGIVNSVNLANTANLANPTSSPNFDLLSCVSATANTQTYNRFQPYGTVEYPVPGPNGLPSTYSGQFQYNQTTTSTNIATDSHSTGESQSNSFTAGFGWPGLFSVEFTQSNSNSMTWQNQSSTSRSTSSGLTSYANYSITGPQLSDNYTGPATYNVYLDNVYGTYAFYSDMVPPVTPGDLGFIQFFNTNCAPQTLGPCLAFTPSVQMPNPAQAQQWGSGSFTTSPAVQNITLQNMSQYQMTMAYPAVTFSDPGFQIEPGTDFCSNYPVTAGGTCSLTLEFEPVPSDVVNTPVGASQVVNAYMVAAGTVNAPGDQNILVTNYGVVTGTVQPATYYATLQTSPIWNATIPNLYNFTGSGTTTFKFTNNYPVPVTISSIVLSDSKDFTNTQCVNGGTQYSGTATQSPVPLLAGGTCTLNVTFNPSIGLGDITKISALGTVDLPGLSSTQLAAEPQVTLAYAAASGPPNPTVVISSASVNMSGTYDENCVNGAPCGWQTPDGNPPSGSFTITNNNASSTATIGYPNISGFSFSGCTTLAPNTSCLVTVSGGSTFSCTTQVIVVGTSASCDSNVSGTGTITVSPNSLAQNGIPISVAETVIIQSENGTSVSPTFVRSIRIRGIEQSNQVTVSAKPATGSIALSALSSLSPAQHTALAESKRRSSAENPALRTPARLLPVNPTFVQSTLSIGVGGFTKAVSIPTGTAIEDAAAMVAAQLNAPGSPVVAVANGSVIALTSQVSGSQGNLPLSAAVIGNYRITPSGSTLTGGQNSGLVTNYDSGVVQVNLNGVTASAEWNSTSTPQSIAEALAASINQVAGTYWSASANDGVISLTSVSNAPTSEATTSTTAPMTLRHKPSAIRVASTGVKPQTTTSANSSQIGVTVTDSAGFSPPSFNAAVN